MNKFAIVTDSCANISQEIIDAHDVHIMTLTYLLDGVEKAGYVKGQKLDYAGFYNALRNKVPAATSQATPNQAREVFLPILESGQDALFIGLSSGLSGTVAAVSQAAESLKEQFPDRTIICVDSLSATIGYGMMVLRAIKMREEGKTLEETGEWLDEIRHKALHYFTIDDLFHLKRGGRLSAMKAIMGSALNVKPLLTVSREGKLVPIGKARGRTKALDGLVDSVSYIDPSIDGTVYIVHGDCQKDAEYSADRIREKHKGLKVEVIDLDPVIGVHSGPGTVAIIFFGNKGRDV
ncbi:MAG: DegV family protein [Clostridiales bacterium]|nr:DegV family protein [Clostridiales bacterium]